jgi:hypothetical protein
MGAVEAVSLRALRRRTSAKWRTHPPDVLPLPVAEALQVSTKIGPFQAPPYTLPASE